MKLTFAKAERIVAHIRTEEREFRYLVTKPLNSFWQEPYVNNFSAQFTDEYRPQNEEENHGTSFNVALRFNDKVVLLSS